MNIEYTTTNTKKDFVRREIVIVFVRKKGYYASVCISQRRPNRVKSVVANIDVDREFIGQIVNSCNSKPVVTVVVDTVRQFYFV